MTEDSNPRAPVQAEGRHTPAGWIDRWEHEKAWKGYRATYGSDQSATRIAERGGFGYSELVRFLGHEPETWRRRS